MDKDLKLDILKKALLYECQGLIEEKKGNAFNHPQVFNRVTSFYTQIRDKFSIVIDVPRDSSDPMKADEKSLDQRLWLEENNIVAFINHNKFYFMNEEDATAFKLRWE